MRDWELAGLSFGKWLILLFWFIIGGLITSLFSVRCLECVKSIGESKKTSPAYWKGAVAVFVCVLIFAGITVLLIKAGRKSAAAMVVEFVLFIALFAVTCLIISSEVEREEFITRMENRERPSKIQEHNTALVQVIEELDAT